MPQQQSKYKGLLDKTQWQRIAVAIKNLVADLEGGAGEEEGLRRARSPVGPVLNTNLDRKQGGC